MIHSFVIYCMVLNQYICRTFEIVPADGHVVASLMECMRGGMMGSSEEFTFEGARWQTKGVQCREERDNDVETWLRDQKRALTLRQDGRSGPAP